ncbi:hypothetical protein [Ancylobacter polymorphus]|uniref:Flagellar motor switch protein FliG n=1 Tax=Ancylobacter polymorphus TaxID=223390 RepID=A0ABU0BHL8_9HYPH|nr:hypothetical protein [Ancylobacter polymorphus]MDQ0305338.1 hypothetical protein [Ancylobacter polymorphus]
MAERQDLRPYVVALIAMQVRTMSEIAAMASTPEKARSLMFHFEAKTIEDIGKVMLSLAPDDPAETMERLRAEAAEIVSSLFASTQFR